jgi:hypothetical protein
MRRRKLIAAVGLAVVVAVGTFVCWPRVNRCTQVNFVVGIRPGMTLAEVEAVIGPPGDYRTIRTVNPFLSSRTVSSPAMRAKLTYARELVFVSKDESHEYLVWLGDEGDGFVWLCAGVVDSKGFTTREKVAQTRLDDLLWRAERLWYRCFPPK